MAKTKKKQIIKEPVEIKQDEVLMNEDISNKLHPDHLLALEVGERDLENMKLQMSSEEQLLRNLNLERLLLDVRIDKQKISLVEKSKRYEAEKNKFTCKKREIWSQYGLGEKDPLGYNPLTGDIIK